MGKIRQKWQNKYLMRYRHVCIVQTAEYIKGYSRNRASVSALSVGAYTTTLYVMVDIVKGVGVHAPPPLPPHKPGLIFPSWWNVCQKVAIATLYTLWCKRIRMLVALQYIQCLIGDSHIFSAEPSTFSPADIKCLGGHSNNQTKSSAGFAQKIFLRETTVVDPHYMEIKLLKFKKKRLYSLTGRV